MILWIKYVLRILQKLIFHFANCVSSQCSFMNDFECTYSSAYSTQNNLPVRRHNQMPHNQKLLVKKKSFWIWKKKNRKSYQSKYEYYSSLDWIAFILPFLNIHLNSLKFFLFLQYLLINLCINVRTILLMQLRIFSRFAI